MTAEPFDALEAAVRAGFAASRAARPEVVEHEEVAPVIAIGQVVSESSVPAVVQQAHEAQVATFSGPAITWSLEDYEGGPDPLNYGSGALKLADSGVAPLVVAARGYRTFSARNHAQAHKAFPALPRGNNRSSKLLKDHMTMGDALLMPWFGLSEVLASSRAHRAPYVTTVQYRPSSPRVNADTGKPIKYEFPFGSQSPLGLHPVYNDEWVAESPTVLVAEGLLKADAALSGWLVAQGYTREDLSYDGSFDARERLAEMMGSVSVQDRIVILSIVGSGNWHQNTEWTAIDLNKREVWIGMDADVATNAQVHTQASKMWDYLSEKRLAHKVALLSPFSGDGEEKAGLDDYLAKIGTWADLMESGLHSELPPIPRKSQDSLAEVEGSTKVTMDLERGQVRRLKVKRAKDEMGDTYLTPVVTTIAEFSARIVATTEARDAYREDDDLSLLHDVEINVNGRTHIVRAWPDEDLHRIDDLLRRCGAAFLAVEWYESRTPSLDRDIAGAIRRSIDTDDHSERQRWNRTGPVWTSDTDGKTVPVFVGTKANGSIAPAGRERLEAVVESSVIGDGVKFPRRATDQERVGLVESIFAVTNAFSDPTSLFAVYGMLGKATILGAKPRGGLYVGTQHGSGKSVLARYANGLGMGPADEDAPSAVNVSRTLLEVLPDNRDALITVVDDIMRTGEEDRRETAAMDKSISMLGRRAYDGPGAARKRTQAADTKTGGKTFHAGDANKAYPSVAMFGELDPGFLSASSSERTLCMTPAMGFMKPGLGSKVILPLCDQRIPHAITADVIRTLLDGRLSASAALWEVDTLSDLRSIRAEALTEFLSSPRMKSLGLTYRQTEVVGSTIMGLEAFAEWMRDAAPAMTDRINRWLARGTDMLIEAQKEHAERNAHRNASPSQRFVYAVRSAMSGGRGVLLSAAEHAETKPGEYRGAPVMGIFEEHDQGKASNGGQPRLYLSWEVVAEVLGMAPGEVKARCRELGGERDRKTIMRTGRSVYTFDPSRFLGDDEEIPEGNDDSDLEDDFED